MTWLRCESCSHVFTDGYFSPEVASVVFSKAHENQKPASDMERQRPISARVVERVARHVSEGAWLDVGFGNGSLLFTAAEWGFEPVGIDLRQSSVDAMARFGVEVHCVDIASLNGDGRFSVVSMADVLEHMPFPKVGLTAARRLLKDGGVLFISMPNFGCPLWQFLDSQRTNPYWSEIEHFHNFSRARLYALLKEMGFTPLGYDVSQRYRVCMEIVARYESR